MNTARDTATNQTRWERIIGLLHSGVTLTKVKAEATALLRETSAQEMADIEEQLLQKGIPKESVQALCDLHAQIFDDALALADTPVELSGHPVHTFLEENKVARRIIANLTLAATHLRADMANEQKHWLACRTYMKQLKIIEYQYLRIETLVFPRLHAHDVSHAVGGLRDHIEDIRRLIEYTRTHLYQRDRDVFVQAVTSLSEAVNQLIEGEEKHLFPVALCMLDDIEWADIKKKEAEIGYAWVIPGDLWDANLATVKSVQPFGSIHSHALTPPGSKRDSSADHPDKHQ